jgi:hypothetical protein
MYLNHHKNIPLKVLDKLTKQLETVENQLNTSFQEDLKQEVERVIHDNT